VSTRLTARGRTTSTPPGADTARSDAPRSDAPGFDAGLVLAWGVPRLRDLPWRRTRDPWSILVAEVMLQQTQVPRVIPRWTAFLDAFTTPAACAAAPLGDVLLAWMGLGYPRRGANLHRTAVTVTRDHGGGLPDDLAALRALPGIGPYTARAVLAFAYERDVAVVDTNIARVLARVGGSRLTPSGVQRAADRLVPAGTGWVWNQTLMDLGATVCRPRPRCAECPLAPVCAWHRAGHPAPDPATGSAGVSTSQAPYEGSDRQARGDVLRAVAAGPVDARGLRPDIVASLVADGLVVECDGVVSLP
jgi:A/G-specific adenine glycosylase